MVSSNTSLPVVSSDFFNLQPIGVSVTSALPSAEIRLFATNDEVTLEYDDRVLLDFNPTFADLVPALEDLGEYVRHTAIVNIIDNDSKFSLRPHHLEYTLFSAVLEINFGETDYSIEEGSGELTCPITLQFRNNQNPFTVMLSPVTVATAEGMGLGFFINSMTITASSRATAGMPGHCYM